MRYRMSHILLLICLALAGFVSTYAQAGADNKGSILAKPGEDDKETAPKTFRESLEKMRIEKDKKDHDQMIERGSELVKLTEELEKDVEANGRLSEKEKPKLSTVEKLAKKIRSELGGDNDNGDDDENPTANSIPQVTQDRIFEAARNLKYRPNHIARSLRAQRTRTRSR